VLAGLLLIGGIAGPDTLGDMHGHYLSQRVVLLGLAALVPLFDFEARGWTARAAGLALVGAVALQSAFVWDYAFLCRRTAGAIMGARRAVGGERTVVGLPAEMPRRFRANPLLHADNLLGVGTGNIVWSNYETQFYYFPVQFRDGLDRPPSGEIEEVVLGKVPPAEGWAKLLRRHHRKIDVLVVWGSDPKLDAISDRWFRPVFREGSVRVLQHREGGLPRPRPEVTMEPSMTEPIRRERGPGREHEQEPRGERSALSSSPASPRADRARGADRGGDDRRGSRPADALR
jgi:hypothetical protein